MMNGYRRGTAGFVLIEALVAVLIVALGMLALTKLEALMIASAGDARARSQAVTLARAKTDELRSAIIRAQYNAAVVAGTQSQDTVTLGANTFTRNWDVTQDATLQQRLVKVYVTWTNTAGNTLRVDLNTLIAWDDTIAEVKLTTSTGQNLITPTGSAKRGVGRYTGGGVTVGTTAGNTTQLIDTATNKVILYLDPGSNGGAQQFTTISGRVYFDQTANSNAIPTSDNVRVRLSSEGECIYDSTPLIVLDSKYRYYAYTCYVGPGWYGNIAVVIDDDVNGGAATPTICVGDPFFNNGTTNSTSYSAHPIESSLRSYRGYYYNTTTQVYLTRGAWGGTAYSPSGYPRPSNFPAFYGANPQNNYFNHDFLITNVNNGSCKSKMELAPTGNNPGTTFKQNAGKYYCLTPILQNSSSYGDQTTNDCPAIWPGYEAEVAPSGSINWLLTVNKDEVGLASGTVTSTLTGGTGGAINCGSDCAASFATGASVTLSPTPASGSVFTGWSGNCTGTGACVLAMTARRDVTARFAVGTTVYNLSVVKAGDGTGTVTSNPTGIACGSVCDYGFAPGTQVTLTAVASSGTFSGWSGGGCSGNAATCIVTMNAVNTVTATFQQAAPTNYALTVTKTGTGTGTVSGGTINCGSICTASVAAGSAVPLSAAAGANSVFVGWSGACSGTSSCNVTMSANQTVTAQFSPSACPTPISGTAHDKNGTVSVISPSGAGTCSMNGGNSAGYSCALSTAPGTIVTLRNQRTTGQTYTYNLNVTANCTAQTNVNFP